MARSPAAISEVSRLTSGSTRVLGERARAASTSARLVCDFDPGRRTVARTGASAYGAGHGSTHGRERSATGRSCDRARTVSRAGAPGRRGRPAWPRAAPSARLRRVPVGACCAGVLRPPGQTGPALGVDGGEHQAAEHAEVLEEVDALLGALASRPPPPRTGGRPGWSAPGCRRAGPTRAAGTARSRASARPPTCTAPLILHQLLGVLGQVGQLRGDPRCDRVGGRHLAARAPAARRGRR